MFLSIFLNWNITQYFFYLFIWLVIKSVFLSRFYIIILHLKYQYLPN